MELQTLTPAAKQVKYIRANPLSVDLVSVAPTGRSKVEVKHS